jgi:hypothetical protein
VVEGDAGNRTVAAAALPAVPIETADAKKLEDDYDFDPFAELFAASPDKKPEADLPSFPVAVASSEKR